MAILKGIISKLNGSAGNLTFKQLGGPEAEACSNCASRVLGADNGTEILSPANEQYKGRKSLAAVPEALRAFQGPEGVPKARRAFHWPRAVPYGSNCPAGVPGADNRTEILSPANEQYKGRKSLAAVPEALRAFQRPKGRSIGQGPFQMVPDALKRVPNSSRWFQLRFARSKREWGRG